MYFDNKKNTWSGKQLPPFYNSKISIGRVLINSLRTCQHRIAQVSADSGIELSYREFYLKTIRAAQNIQKLNYQHGEVFSLISKNNHEVAPIMTAILCTGHILNVIDTTFISTTLTDLFREIQPKIVFCDMDSLDSVQTALRNAKIDVTIFTFCGSVVGTKAVAELFSETGNENNFNPRILNDDDETAIIVCSSGTTGIPKRICLSHAVLLYQASNSPLVKETHTILSFNTMHWISGIAALFHGILTHSTRIITTQPYTPEYFFQLIEKYKVSYYVTTGFQVNNQLKSEMISRANFSSVKLVHVGGTKLSYDSMNKYQKYISNGKVIHVYGMTEIGGFSTDNDGGKYNSDTVGYLVPGILSKVIDSFGHHLGPNERGEICVKYFNHIKMGNYLHNPEANKKAFDSEGFFHTGDYGRFDDDGYLYVEDRIGDLIQTEFGLVGPSEIEAALVMQPGINAVCVAAIQGSTSFQLPAAAIVKEIDSNLSEEDVIQFMKQTFPKSKQLAGGIYFVKSMKATPSGKILRSQMKILLNDLFKNKI